jgi:glyoxylate reductase
MAKFKVLVPVKLPPLLRKRLEQVGCELRVLPKGKQPRPSELRQYIRGVNACLSLLTHKIDKDIIAAGLPTLKLIANCAVGYDNIDLDAAKRYGVMVTNTPEILTETVADFTLALILAIARRIVEADYFVRAGKFRGWQPDLFLGSDVYKKTIGIVGLGRIGQAVAQRCVGGFKMKILYTDVLRNKLFEKMYGAKFVKLPQLLQQSDFVTLHIPLLPTTRHLISSKELKLMKPTAYLINTSRGPVVDEKALVQALRKKWIAGASLDVYEYEPKINAGLIKLNNVILTPHIASATQETRQKMLVCAIENILAVAKGKRPKNLVN